MPDADRDLLASMERDGVPSVHNMILSDRVVSKLDYEDALRYATFLSRRLVGLYKLIKPDVVVIGFDAIHSGLALAVARSLDIPAYALNFSVIPAGFACFCERMNPGSPVAIRQRACGEIEALAEASLAEFEARKINARAHIASPSKPIFRNVLRVPGRVSAVINTARRSSSKEFLRFTDGIGKYSVSGAITHKLRTRKAHEAALTVPAFDIPPDQPFVLFGLHMQPESSIDVWAPFFSNQMWVVELLARSIPPTHRLLVKIHKSDIESFSKADFERMCSFPGVELVAPFANAREFIERASMLVAIQGTMGLEAALLGKPVILLGQSPVRVFPNAETIVDLPALPALVRRQLAARPPARDEIVRAYAAYLEPFFRASDNHWTATKTSEEIDGYVEMFDALGSYLAGNDDAQGVIRA